MTGFDIAKREFSAQEREALAEEGKAMPDGSYPIASRADLSNALQSIGRAKNREAVLRHIRRRAKALGLEDTLPEWAVAKMVKCACGDGDVKTLEVLRATSLADMDADDFNDVVVAVNEAGGVTKTVGLPRVLITKAIREFNEGVAKGDYVGHPFRGNQHTDASGASRGGSGGPKRTSTGRTERRRAGRFTAEEQRLAALNEQLSGQVNPAPEGFYDLMEQDARITARVEAEAFAQSMLGQSADIALEGLETQQKGVANLRDMIERDRAEADRRANMADDYDDAEEGDRQRAIMKVKEMVLKLADATNAAIDRAKTLVTRTKQGIDRAADMKAAQENVLPRIRMAREALLRVDKQLADREETARRMGRSGWAEQRQAVGNIALLRAGLREALGAIEDYRADVDNVGEAALEVEQEIRTSQQ